MTLDAHERWLGWAGAVAAEFGEKWQAYCQRVPAWIPRLRRWGYKVLRQGLKLSSCFRAAIRPKRFSH